MYRTPAPHAGCQLRSSNMEELLPVPRRVIERLVLLVESLGDPAFAALNNPVEDHLAPEVLLLDSETEVIASWQRLPPPSHGVPELSPRDPMEFAATLATLLNEIVNTNDGLAAF